MSARKSSSNRGKVRYALPSSVRLKFEYPLQIDFSAPTNSLTINEYGNIGIGAWSSEHKLAVAGSIISEEVVVKLQSNWPDYVFSEDYDLTELSEVEKFIKET